MEPDDEIDLYLDYDPEDWGSIEAEPSTDDLLVGTEDDFDLD